MLSQMTEMRSQNKSQKAIIFLKNNFNNFFNFLLRFLNKNNDNNTSQKFSLLFCEVRDLICRTEKKIGQFKSIESDSLKKILPDIDLVYMHSIIIDIAKLINATKSDRIGLNQFKNIAPKDQKNNIENLENNYKNEILKIKNTRNRIIVHIDIEYPKKNSKEETIRIMEDYKKFYQYIKNENEDDSVLTRILSVIKENEAQNIDDERYSISDFTSDIPRIKLFLNEFLLIIDSINKYYVGKFEK